MLVRTARQRQRRETAQLLASSFAHLNLPWLAPAQLRWSASQSSSAQRSPSTPSPTSQSSPRVRKRSLSRRQPGRSSSSSRALSTAAAEPSQSRYHDPSYSASFSSDGRPHWTHSSQPTSALRPHEAPVVLNTSTALPEPSLKIVKGVMGSTRELLSYLRTNLQTGRYSAAAAILQRMASAGLATSEELARANSAYLQALLVALQSYGRGPEAAARLKEMESWFANEIQARKIPIEAKMIVCLIRGSMRGLDGTPRLNKIREWAQMGRDLGGEIYDEVLFSEDYDDNEFTMLGAMTSDFYEPDELVEGAQEEAIADVSKLQSALEQYRRHDFLPTETLPEVRPTHQLKGSLGGIKRSTQALTDHPSLDSEAPLEDQRRVAYERQLAVEETSAQVAIDMWRQANTDLQKMGINTSLESRPLAALMWKWYEKLLVELKQERDECRKTADSPSPDAKRASSNVEENRRLYAPYFDMVSLEKMAAVTIIHTLTTLVAQKRKKDKKYDTKATIASLTSGLGRNIENEFLIDEAKQRSKGNKDTKRNRLPFNASPQRLRRALARQLRNMKNEQQSRQSGNLSVFGSQSNPRSTDKLGQAAWGAEVQVKLGAMLIDKLLLSAQVPVTRSHPRTHKKITQMQPAFLHHNTFVNGRKIGVVSPNDALLQKLDREPVASMIVKRLPMIFEPKPWTSYDKGGYLRHSSLMLRLKDGDGSALEYLKVADSRGDLDQVYAGLSALGKVPWKIHHGVFQVQLAAWNSGEAIANFAPASPTFDLPPEPEASDDPLPRRRWLNQIRTLENTRAGLHSKRCFQNFQLEVARGMINETIYFPHSIDFRGRAYPIPPYLNHMGADNVRGLLVFAQGKELGPEGLRWLKIHLATVAGHDKASLAERVEFTDKNLEDIYDSARNPLGGRKWWLEAEDAWQTLAACFELTAALDSPDPSKFVSHLPVQQDGTCNGLQHYAALGGDEVGAAQVNLEPGDRPADVYTAVMDAVVKEVHQDALAGDPVALALDGHITRKCVKQPVMTNVYGVTWFGAKEQVKKQLEVIFPKGGVDEVSLGKMSIFITAKIFKSLGQMFTGAQAIQHWLGECAARITTCITPEQMADWEANQSGKQQPTVGSKHATANEKRRAEYRRRHMKTNDSATTPAARSPPPPFKSTIVWTTPLRLPVVQPYRQESLQKVETNLQIINLSEPKAWNPVHKRKQLQAFPPNFIHSLDATHMFLSALKCAEVGITFASIHDSFWCHASDVNRMNRLLREAFIAMHREDVIGRLNEELYVRYKDCMYEKSVPASSPVGRRILVWRRQHFSRKADIRAFEFEQEVKRLRLLKSDDPAERAEGEAMVTPASLLAAAPDDEPSDPADVLRAAINAMPNSANATSEAVGQEDRTGEKRTGRPSKSSAAVNTAGTDKHYMEPVAEHEDDNEGLEADSGAMDDTADEFDEDVDADADADADADDAFSAALPDSNSRASKPGKSELYRKLHVWQPLTFPPVPPKGAFDVTRLQASTYFFH